MKDNLPYFSHDNNARNHPKMKALIAEFGYEGYGRFWALNERIAETSGACIDISKKVNKLDLARELGLDGNGLDRFLSFLSDAEIDLINIVDGKITTDRINELHTKVNKKRKKQRKDENEEIGGENTEIDSENEEIGGDFNTDKIRLDKNRQDKTRQDSGESSAPKRIALLDRKPKNDMERVNKKWLENYIALYGGQPIDPEWGVTSPLVSKVLKQAGIEKTLKALDTAMKDEFCLKAGYMLQVIMSRNVISKLINKPLDSGTIGDLANKKSLSGLSSLYDKGGQK